MTQQINLDSIKLAARAGQSPRVGFGTIINKMAKDFAESFMQSMQQERLPKTMQRYSGATLITSMDGQ